MISPGFLTKTVTLERATLTKDQAGGAARAWNPVGGSSTGVRAAVQPLSAHTIQAYAGRQLQVSHAVYLEVPLPFSRGDRLAASDGRYFSVEGDLDSAGAGRVFKLLVRELLG